MLEEMDNEFGIGNLVEAEFGKNISQSKNQYRAGELAGLKIEHSKTAFEVKIIKHACFFAIIIILLFIVVLILYSCRYRKDEM